MEGKDKIRHGQNLDDSTDDEQLMMLLLLIADAYLIDVVLQWQFAKNCQRHRFVGLRALIESMESS